MTILDGKKTSQKILAQIKSELSTVSPQVELDIVLVGDNPASLKYVNLKQTVGQQIGIKVNIHSLPTKTNTVTVLNLIHRLNQNDKTAGLIVQLPLPSHLNTNSVLNAINPKKDVDGLSPTNLGLLFQNSPKAIVSATPLGIIKLLEEYKISFNGKNAVIIGRSPMIGLPLVALLNNRHSTVTLAHSHTKNLSSVCHTADILISATGKPNLVTPDFVKKDTVVIDVGYPQGDVDFDAAAPQCSYISPVPGGVGPMTIACLMLNILNIYKKNARKK